MANGRTLATGPMPKSRGSQLGEILGAGIGQGAAGSFERQRRERQAMQQFNPIRESLAASLGDIPASTPQQAMLQSLIQDPQAFANFMSDPQSIVSANNVATMAAEPESPTQEVEDELAQIDLMVSRLNEAQQGNQPRRAAYYQSKLNEMTGMSAPKMTDLQSNIRAMGLDPATGEGRRLMMGAMSNRRDLTLTERRINELESRGLSRDQASDIAFGNARIDMSSPNRPRFVNDVTGDVVELEPRVASAAAGYMGGPNEQGVVEDPEAPVGPQPSAEPGQTLMDLVPTATGPAASIRAGLTKPLDFMGLDVPEQTIKARQAFRNWKNDLVRTFAANGDTRIGQQEQEWLRNEVTVDPGMFVGEGEMTSRLEQIRGDILKRADFLDERAADVSLAPSDRDAAANMASQLRDSAQVIGVRDPDGGQGAPELSEDVRSQLPEGASFEGFTEAGHPVYQTPDGRRLVVEPGE